MKVQAAGEIRTPDPLGRSQVLSSAELRRQSWWSSRPARRKQNRLRPRESRSPNALGATLPPADREVLHNKCSSIGCQTAAMRVVLMGDGTDENRPACVLCRRGDWFAPSLGPMARVATRCAVPPSCLQWWCSCVRFYRPVAPGGRPTAGVPRCGRPWRIAQPSACSAGAGRSGRDQRVGDRRSVSSKWSRVNHLCRSVGSAAPERAILGCLARPRHRSCGHIQMQSRASMFSLAVR